MSKIDVRRLQMLARQRQKLEEEAAQLQAEVDAMVPLPFPLLRIFCLADDMPSGTGTCREEEVITMILHKRISIPDLLYNGACVLLAFRFFTFLPSAIPQ